MWLYSEILIMLNEAFDIVCIDDKYFYYDAGEDLIGPFNFWEDVNYAFDEYAFELNNLGW